MECDKKALSLNLLHCKNDIQSGTYVIVRILTKRKNVLVFLFRYQEHG